MSDVGCYTSDPVCENIDSYDQGDTILSSGCMDMDDGGCDGDYCPDIDTFTTSECDTSITDASYIVIGCIIFFCIIHSLAKV